VLDGTDSGFYTTYEAKEVILVIEFLVVISEICCNMVKIIGRGMASTVR